MRSSANAKSGCRRAAGQTLLAACILLLTACGMFKHKEKQPLYYSAVETQPLEIPPGLDKPASSSALVITTPSAPLAQNEMQTVPPRISSQSGSDKNSSRIRWSAEGAYLLVPDTQDSVYRRLGLAIKRSGMSVSDKNLQHGYRFEYWHDSKDPDRGFFSKLAFWRHDAPDYSGSYQAVTQADGENTRIFIRNADGSEVDQAAAEHLLSILRERLG